MKDKVLYQKIPGDSALTELVFCIVHVGKRRKIMIMSYFLALAPVSQHFITSASTFQCVLLFVILRVYTRGLILHSIRKIQSCGFVCAR